MPEAADEWPEESVPVPLRRSRAWAVAAFLALLTSLWSPWWLLSFVDDAGVHYDRVAAAPFRPEVPATTAWGPHVAGVLLAAAALWSFVRLAGRSHAYEPGRWRRDLCLQAVLVAAAWASTPWWPDQVPSFWGGRTLRAGDATFTETAMPGVGWWIALLAAILFGVAWWVARPPRRDRSRDPP